VGENELAAEKNGVAVGENELAAEEKELQWLQVVFLPPQ